jgi:hypothetical protein
MRSEVFKVEILIVIFWIMMSYSLVGCYQLFGGTFGMKMEETGSSDETLEYYMAPQSLSTFTPRWQLVFEKVTKMHCHFKKIWPRLNTIKTV